MDSALILKKKFESGEITDYGQALPYLEKSELVAKLLEDFDQQTPFLLNRLIELSEIPFTWSIGKVRQWTNKLADTSFSGESFSLTGESHYTLACYNAMITSTLIRLKHENSDPIEKGIEWIIKYQSVNRTTQTQWTGEGIGRYGGCMKKTPCYIGLVKSMIALTDYKKQNNCLVDNALEAKLSEGLEYILNQKVYKRLSSDLPVTPYIDKLTYPFTWKTNIIEILRLLKDNGLTTDARCKPAFDLLKAKQKKSGFWQINSMPRPKRWVSFDTPSKPALWLSHEIEKLISL